jgi:hypothetical protein
MALTSAEFSMAQANRVSAAYKKKFGSRPDVLRCATGAGAMLLD